MEIKNIKIAGLSTINCKLTNKRLIPWSVRFLDMLTAVQRVTKCPAFQETPQVRTRMSIRIHHWALLWASLSQHTPQEFSYPSSKCSSPFSYSEQNYVCHSRFLYALSEKCWLWRFLSSDFLPSSVTACLLDSRILYTNVLRHINLCKDET